MLFANTEKIGDYLQGVLFGYTRGHNSAILNLHLILLLGIIIISLVIIG